MTNSNEAKATPRPWKLGHEIFDNTHSVVDGSRRIDGKDGMLLAYVSDRNLIDKTLRDADASLIVKAVNNHEQLLEACREAESHLQTLNYSEWTESVKRCHIKAIQGLRKAIANAEGR